MSALPPKADIADHGLALMVFSFVSTAHAGMASVYGGPDGYCGSPTANGERVDCSAMTAAHRRLPFGARVRVCHSGCVTVRINDRGPWVRGRDIDLSPEAAVVQSQLASGWFIGGSP